MERLLRRLLAAVVVVCGFSGAALAGTAAAATTIDVGTGPAGGRVSPAVMGSDFLQPFGGMGSFDSTTDAFEPSFLTDLSEDTFTGSIRFPGGIAADFYDWKRAIGPQSGRTDNAYGPNTGPSPSTVGPDEFGQLLDKTGASGLITTNFSTGTAQEAADWVSYMTGSSGIWATERAANGHPQPYNVPMWEVGNEEQSAANSWRSGTPVSVGGPSTCVSTTDCEYIYGGTTSFTAQPVVGFADRSLGASDSTGAANQSFFVKYPPVSPGSQTIFVDGTKWTEVSSLAAAGPADDVYTIDDTTGEITFGDGTNGAVPPTGAPVTASYESGPHDGFVAFYQAMKAVNPNIQVCATDTDTAFVQDAGSTIPYDCLQYHPYETATDSSGNIGNFETSVMNAPVNELATLQMWQSAIQGAAGHAIPLELSEYGSIMGDTPDPTLVPYYYDSLDEALLNASQLATWINAGISVADRQLLDAETPAVADVAVGLPGGAPFATTGGIVTPGPNAVGPDVLAEPDVAEPTAQYFQLFQPLAGGTLLGTTTSGNPTLSQLMSGEAVGDLSVVAATTGDQIDTVVINRSPTDSVPTQLNLTGANDGPATITTLNAVDGGDALSFNTSAGPDTVSTTSSEGTVQNETLAVTFPAHSISLVQVNAASSPPPVVGPPPVDNPPSPGQPATGDTTPTATPVSSASTSISATISAKHVVPVTILAIKLAGAKVIWCKRCTYPKTKLSFRLTGSAQVRIKLLAKKAVAKHRANAETDWRKLAGVTVAGHKGANSFQVGKRWHKRLMPDATMQILVQMKSAKTWKTEKTLRLTVLAEHGHV